MPEADLIVEDLAELATPTGPGPHAGPKQGALRTVEDATVAFQDGHVAAVGTRGDLADWSAPEVVDGSGGTLVPGLVDAHTHPVFAGDRADELRMKLEGASYEEILEAGGGIHSTVEATRAASQDQLADLLTGRLDRLLALGTTTLEAKTGYALTVPGELELLDVLLDADEHHAVDLAVTLLGAHAVPQDAGREAYLDDVCGKLTTAAAERGAGFVDVFVDEGAFTVEEGRRVLEAGRDAGLDVRIHADELACTRATRLGVELGAASVDHVNQVHEDDVAAMADRERFPGVATLCPVTPFTSSIRYAPARGLIHAGVPVALGSDLNPNAWSEGMLFAIALAVHGMRMRPAEALVAATANSAYSLGMEDRGHLTEGALGDAVLLDFPSHEHLGYRMGGDPVRAVVKEGQLVEGGASAR